MLWFCSKLFGICNYISDQNSMFAWFLPCDDFNIWYRRSVGIAKYWPCFRGLMRTKQWKQVSTSTKAIWTNKFPTQVIERSLKSYCSWPNISTLQSLQSCVFIRCDHCENRIKIYTLKDQWWSLLIDDVIIGPWPLMV